MNNIQNNNINNNNYLTINESKLPTIPTPTSKGTQGVEFTAQKVSLASAKDLNCKTYMDPFTLAAKGIYMVKGSKVDTDKNARLIVENDTVALAATVSKKPKAVIQSENRTAVRAFSAYIKEEIGESKCQQIQRDYGFSLVEMELNGEPLHPKYVFYFNIGANNIEMNDYNEFQYKVKYFVGLNHDENLTLKEYFTNEIKFHHLGTSLSFSVREMRNMLAEFGENTHLSEVKKKMSLSANPSEKDLNLFTKICYSITSDMHTGREIENTIKGSYAEKGFFTDFEPWIDQQELLQIFPELKSVDYNLPYAQLGPTRKQQFDRIYHELLVKVVVKKHLMRFDGQKFRVGELIPSPYRDANGDTVWYRVEEGVDSGLGKMWYTLVPASNSYDKDLPVFRIYRDTSTNPYAQSGSPTISRDFKLGYSSGYYFSDTTESEDASFFQNFTLPSFLASMLASEKTASTLKCSAEQMLKACEDLLDSGKITSKEKEEQIIDQMEKLERAINGLKPKNSIGENILTLEVEQTHKVLIQYASSQDLKLYQNLKSGKTPARPLHVVGNSLGGFDAQYDLVQQLSEKGRVPVVPINLYCHSAIRIEEKDNKAFIKHLEDNHDTIKTLGVTMHFDFITEDNDKVSKIGNNHSYLGLQNKSTVQDILSTDFRVISTAKETKNPTLQLGEHMNRFENTCLGSEIKHHEYTNDPEAFNKEHSYTKWEFGRKIVGVANSVFEPLWKAKREIVGRRGDNHGFAKMHVQYKDGQNHNTKYKPIN